MSTGIPASVRMTRHLLIASEQIWPNLLGLAWLVSRDGGVVSLDILHTSDVRRSAEPARRIAAIAGLVQPGLHVTLHQTETITQAVLQTIHTIVESGGGVSSRWSLNVTGGTKTMFAGALPFVRLPFVEAFYREVSGQWFQLQAQDLSGIQTLSCVEIRDASTALVEIPVLELIRAQAKIPEGSEWSQNPPPPELDLPAITVRGIALRWDWKTLQREFPQLSQGQTGFAFEDFFGSLLRVCGAANFAASVKLSQGGRVLHELDFVVSTGRKIIVFDLKLTDTAEDTAVIDQISRLAEDAAALGGSDAVPVAVRPTWVDADGIRSSVALAHRVTLWDQRSMGNLIERLVKLLELPTPATGSPADEVAKAFADATSRGNRLFSGAKLPTTPTGDRSIENTIGWIGLDPYAAECRSFSAPVIVVELQGRYLVSSRLQGGPWKNADEFQTAFNGLATVEWCRTTGNSPNKGLLALLTPMHERGPAVRELLRNLSRL